MLRRRVSPWELLGCVLKRGVIKHLTQIHVGAVMLWSQLPSGWTSYICHEDSTWIPMNLLWLCPGHNTDGINAFTVVFRSFAWESLPLRQAWLWLWLWRQRAATTGAVWASAVGRRLPRCEVTAGSWEIAPNGKKAGVLLWRLVQSGERMRNRQF